MDDILFPVIKEIAAQGPLVAFMFWIIYENKRSMNEEKINHAEQIEALAKRYDTLVKATFDMSESILSVVSENTKSNGILAEKIHGLKS